MIASFQIERLGLESQGVGYDAYKNIYFVKGAVPGDFVRVEFRRTEKRYRDASLVEVLKPSQDRQVAKCPYSGGCGGCDLLELKYEAQVRAKAEIVKHVLERGGYPPKVISPMLGAGQIYGYRNRIQLRREGERLGFYRRASHEVVDIESCAVAHPLLNEEIKKLRLERGDHRKIELFIRSDGSIGRVYNSAHAREGFGQVHSEQNEKLKKVVREFIVGSHAERVLELYCGDGNLTFGYSPHIGHVLGVDSNLHSIENARKRAGNSPCFAFECNNVDPTLSKKLSGMGVPYDTVVLDPPREGAGGVLKYFIHPGLKAVIYVSCSPVTFSQDIQSLKQSHFSFETASPIDMFPHTRHTELVGYFSR